LISRYRDFLEEVGFRKAVVHDELADDVIGSSAAAMDDISTAEG
jgi:hypothetical protein